MIEDCPKHRKAILATVKPGDYVIGYGRNGLTKTLLKVVEWAADKKDHIYGVYCEEMDGTPINRYFTSIKRKALPEEIVLNS